MFKKLFRVPFCIFLLVLTASCTIVHHDEAKNQNSEGVTFYFDSADFNAVEFVKENWDSRIIPEIKENAVSLDELLEQIRRDEESAVSEYGIKKEVTSPYSFIVKGEYPVKELDRSSAVGLLYLDLGDLGDGHCALQVGPVFKLSTIRDSLSFINFGDFVNQIEFANVSREINFYIRDNVASVIGESLPEESTVSFYGAFSMDKDGKVIVTPVILDSPAGE